MLAARFALSRTVGRAKAASGRRASGATRAVVTILGIVLSIAPSMAAMAQGRRTTTIRLEEIRVEGRIQKPQAFYILPRSNLDYEALDRSESFLNKIEESVGREPF
jgi:hypothetical protein